MKKLILLLLFIPLVSLGQNKYAKDITYEVDKFDGKKTWYSPLLMKGLSIPNWVSFWKVDDGDIVATYIRLIITGASLSTGEKGAIVLFEDGTKLDFPDAEIDVEVSKYGYWQYSAFIQLGEKKLQHFIDKDINAFKLYIYPKEKFRKKDVERIKGWAKAIKDSK